MATMKDLEQSVIELGVKLCQVFSEGKVINDGQAKALDAIIRLYSVARVREPPEKVSSKK